MAGENGWALHIPGPDETYAMPSKALAEWAAECHNADIGRLVRVAGVCGEPL